MIASIKVMETHEMPGKRKSSAVFLRLTPEMKEAVWAEANRFGSPSEVLRELLRAFVEGRVTVKPPSDVKESLYDARNQD